MTTLIAGIICILSGLVCFISFVVSKGPKMAKVGDVYAHVNPGLSDNPNEPNDPFISIRTVMEIKDGKARIHSRYLNLVGPVLEGESWGEAFGLGGFDKQLIIFKPEPTTTASTPPPANKPSR